METPPLDLNTRVEHVSILQSLDLSVKRRLPAVAVCPFCRQETLSVHLTPTGGCWYACSGCGFCGDSIELYCKAHDLPDIRDAVYELAESNILSVERNELPVSVVDGYVIGYVEHRRKLTDLFKRAQQNLSRITPHWIRLLQGLHLWDGFRANIWRRQIGRYVGGTTLRELAEFGISIPKRSFHHCIICPYYDLPGRISSFLFIGSKNRFTRVRVQSKSAEPDDGLMMLGTLKPYNDVIVALKDPIFALQLQRKNLVVSTEPLEIVVYSSGTTKAWDSVHARRTVYWEQNRSADLFLQAKRQVRSFIAGRPRFRPGRRDRWLAGHTPAQVLDILNRSAQSWAEAMKAYILEDKYWQVAALLSALDLSDDDLQDIYDVCTPYEEQRVKQLLGETSYERSVRIRGLRIVESDDIWWIIRKGQKEIGSNVILRIERAVHVRETDEDQYEGVIVVRGKHVRFCEKIETVEKGTAGWMRRILMRNGFKPPVIQRILYPHLVTLAKQFHEPEYVRRVARIGWHQDKQAFVFPNFVIRRKGVDEIDGAAVAGGGNAPASGIRPPVVSDGDWDVLLDDCPAWAAVWAGLAGFMANMLSPVTGSRRQPLAFVGGPGTIAGVIGEHLAGELGMLTATLTDKRHPTAGMDSLLRRYGYPVWLDMRADDRRGVRRLDAGADVAVMTCLLEDEAAALAVGEGWVFVHAQEMLSRKDKLPSLQGSMRFLAWLQARDFDMPLSSSTVCSVLLALKDWADDEIGMTETGIFARADAMLQATDSVSLDRRFMHLIYQLRAESRLKTGHISFYDNFRSGIPPGRPHILIDDERKKVCIRLSKLRGAISRLKLPRPDINSAMQALAGNAATNGFEAVSDDFVVDQSYWEAEMHRWRRLRA